MKTNMVILVMFTLSFSFIQGQNDIMTESVIFKNIETINRSHELGLSNSDLLTIYHVRKRLKRDLSIRPWMRIKKEEELLFDSLEQNSYSKYLQLIKIQEEARVANEIKTTQRQYSSLQLNYEQAKKLMFFKENLEREIIENVSGVTPKIEIEREVGFMKDLLDSSQYRIYITEKILEIERFKTSLKLSAEKESDLQGKVENLKKKIGLMRNNFSSIKGDNFNQSTSNMSNYDLLINLKNTYEKCLVAVERGFETRYRDYFGDVEVKKEKILFELDLYMWKSLPDFDLLEYYTSDSILVESFKLFVLQNMDLFRAILSSAKSSFPEFFNQSNELSLVFDNSSKRDLERFAFLLVLC